MSIYNFYPHFAIFLYTQNEKKQSPHLKRAPIKYPKWKFLSQTDHSVIFNQLYSKLSLYSKWASGRLLHTLNGNFHKTFHTSMFINIITWNQKKNSGVTSFCIFNETKILELIRQSFFAGPCKYLYNYYKKTM